MVLRIIESYHRIIEWPGLKRKMNIEFQPPCYVQGCQPADQAAQSHIQPGPECLQGWGIHSFLGQPVPVCHCKNFLLPKDINKKPHKNIILGLYSEKVKTYGDILLPRLAVKRYLVLFS